MLEQLSEDYIRTALASGLPKWTIVMRYALPNALIPQLRCWGWRWSDLLYGAVLTETVLPGPGWAPTWSPLYSGARFPGGDGFCRGGVLLTCWSICSSTCSIYG